MSLEIGLMTLVFAAAFAVLFTGRGRLINAVGWALILAISFVAASTLAAAWSYSRSDLQVTTEQEITNRPVAIEQNGYISSQKCRACHPHHHETWHSSHHRTMTQVPTSDSVIADFDNKVIRRAGREFRFFREHGEYFMEITGDGPASSGALTCGTYKIVLSTGAHHQQSFWCETDEGRTLRNVPFIWITSEERWIPYMSIFMVPHQGLSMHAGSWNRTCVKCHVVGGQPRHDPQEGYDTQVAEFGISCEACHGPAENHADIHRNPVSRYRQHFSALDDPTLVNPADLSHVQSSQTCGQCHSIFEFHDEQGQAEFNESGFAYRPGDDLRDSRHLFQVGQDEDLPVVKRALKRNPTFFENQFWSDGMVRVSGREYNGLLESPCYQRGKMSCLSCHEMHPSESDHGDRKAWADDQLKPEMRGNDSCLQCHEEYRSEEQLTAHTHHSRLSSGSNCYNCHMPHTTLGLMKAMRSHTIDSPNVETTVATGRPNACNVCHLDQTLAWTASRLEEWYAIPAPELSKEQHEVASSVLSILKGDAGQRAIAGWHLGWAPAQEASGTDWMAPYLAELLTDSYDVVRYIGYHSLKELPEFGDFEYDFVGPKESREQNSQQALQSWSEMDERPTPAASLLINAQGGLNKDAFEKLRSQQSKSRILLIE